ncbi:hypothetical protein HJFPF1_03087 [Paramyrothecium foliicola]|nr:hypothetical protein HJFPF1_03087 [Paramyrothecium foliicola]
MSQNSLTQTLADAFNALADQVQALADHKTVLEHKLRFAHEQELTCLLDRQFQFLADKYAPANSEITETLSKLQLPPHNSVPVDDNSTVPLPHRAILNNPHDVALIIRDGRRVASQLASIVDASKTTGSSRETVSRAFSDETSMATTLEHDFTIEGRKGNLQCPFSKMAAASDGDAPEVTHHDGVPDGTPHHSSDPICAAMYEEATSQTAAAANGASSSKCPIRYMDQHSAEEIAHYVETHKHELPRSHEVCLRRYQRNEDEIRKLDSKYGNLVSMIEGLTHIHQPMLPEAEAEEPQQRSDVEKASNERVESWAKDVSATTDPEEPENTVPADDDRQSHFDRPLKEVRVGESPSRPWGISVPVYEQFGHEDHQPMSPPPAPVRMTSPVRSMRAPIKSGGKCPFDHTKLSAMPNLEPHSKLEPSHSPHPSRPPPHEDGFPTTHEKPPPSAAQNVQPAFINPELPKATGGPPQMIFTGPVFIGYPMEQAIQFMNQYRASQ